MWELWKLGDVVDGGDLGCVCGRLVVPHILLFDAELCLSLGFSQLLTEALYTLEGSVLCSGFVRSGLCDSKL